MDLSGKRGIIFGVLNEYSIAYGILEKLQSNNAEIGIACVNSKIKEKLQKKFSSNTAIKFIEVYDAANSQSIDHFFNKAKKYFDNIDFIVHAIAYMNAEHLSENYMTVTQEDFSQSMRISVYSLIEITRKFHCIMNKNCSIITLSYLGAIRYIPHYNAMGVVKAALESTVRYLSYELRDTQQRVNAISAGPIKTLASSGISEMRKIIAWNKYNSLIAENVNISDVGNLANFLISDMGTHIMGQVLYVDNGFNKVGMLNKKHIQNTAELINSFV